MRREAVKDEPYSQTRQTHSTLVDTPALPLSAPKQEMATMSANGTPPTGPNNARPKSRATVLLFATVSCHPQRQMQMFTLALVNTLSRTPK